MKLSERLIIRLSPEQRYHLDVIAEINGMNASEMLRDWIDKVWNSLPGNTPAHGETK